MERVTDWVKLWRELVEAQSHMWKREKPSEADEDHWRDKARSFSESVKQRWAKPDSHRDFILSLLKAHPASTVLDIGAGTGGWAVPMARFAAKVTAIEPSADMILVLRENLGEEGVRNVDIIRDTWPDAGVEPHDFSLCSHAMYGFPDLPAFVRAMTKVTKNTCLMLMRAPSHDGIMARAAMKIWGQPHDSPNFQVAYSALLQIGLYPHVLMGDPDQWPPWTSATCEEALAEIKRRFALQSTPDHDAFSMDLLKSRLIFRDGKYVWPLEVRSALVYWKGSA
jgi:2-polyprenyl-3-methyl-5-hydroxy-6-metoxy-1,4-benzoquinol methylase